MAFTYTVVKADALAVNDQVRAIVCADGHAYSFPVPTTGGATFPSTVKRIVAADVPAGTDSAGGTITNTSVLWTIYLNNASQFALPNQATINDTVDFVVKATGTA
jgi:hypothetical protein